MQSSENTTYICAVRTPIELSSDAGSAIGALKLGRNCIRSAAKIDAAQDDAGRVALELSRYELARGALFDPVAQSQKLFFALLRRGARDVFQIVHRRGADGAGYLPGAVHHGKREHHAVVFITSDVAACERDRAFLPKRSSNFS